MHVNAPLPKLPNKLSAFQPIINKMMAKQAADRYATVDEVIADIDEITGAPVPETGTAARSRLLVVAGAGTALLVAVGVVLYLMVVRPGDVDQPPRVELTADQQQSLDNLVAMAGLYKEAGRLVDPPISNAVYALYEALAIDPYDERALAMLDDIANHYRMAAEAALRRGDDRHTVEQLIEFGLQARKDDEALQALLVEVRAR
jgi:hypothetical protein